jgi:hypothetical protein
MNKPSIRKAYRDASELMARFSIADKVIGDDMVKLRKKMER